MEKIFKKATRATKEHLTEGKWSAEAIFGGKAGRPSSKQQNQAKGKKMGVQATKSFDEYLKDQLQNPLDSAEYLNVVLEEGNESALMIALRHVVDALGVSSVAEKAGLNRENLYRMLSEKGNPRLSSFLGVLEAVGLRLAIEPVSARTIRREDVYAATKNINEALASTNIYETLATLAPSAYQKISNSQTYNHTLNHFEESEDEIIEAAA